MRLDHLGAVLDRAQQPVSAGEIVGECAIQPICSDECGDCVERRRRTHRRIAAAVNHLLDLNEELDLADSAAPALEVEPRSDVRALREMVANSGRYLTHLFNYSEIERAAPNKRVDSIEE